MTPSRSFRDRFWSRPVARAVTSPSAIVAFGATAAVGVALFGPLGLVAGLAGYGARVLWAVPRNPRGDHIDPFAVDEPWRRFVQEALQAQDRFRQAVAGMAPGPLQDNLRSIADRLGTAVAECWRVANRGQRLADARRQIDADAVRAQLAGIRDQAQEKWAAGSTLAETATALEAQVGTADRLDALVADARSRLQLLDARLDEAVTRAIELSAQAETPGELTGLATDVDGIVTGMEALRLALEETGAAPPASLPSPGTAPGLEAPQPPAAPGPPETEPPA